MGLQNALVSMISGSFVRTTHLTGTFTGPGIELAQILDKNRKDKLLLRSKINLRLIIIVFFLAGAPSPAQPRPLTHEALLQQKRKSYELYATQFD